MPPITSHNVPSSVKPRPAVIALAQFSLQGESLATAIAQLKAEDDWQEWLANLELHGLSGFANKHVDEHDLPIPTAVRMQLKALKIRHTAAANARAKVLGQIDAAFKEQGINYVALKGAALAPYVYQQEYLRPMRDMDLLIPREQLHQSGQVLRGIGFEMPDEQPTKYMRDMHQLPNATKVVDGFTCSVELHRDGISREVTGHYYYPSNEALLQTIEWHQLSFYALDDVPMLHQVSRHLEGLHPAALQKLINVMDVILLAEKILESGQWPKLEREFPHVINTLCCLHLLTPLPASLQAKIGNLPKNRPQGVGVIMGSLRSGLLKQKGLRAKLKPLLSPSDWWLYLYYNTHPDKSLLWIKLVRHPLRLCNWLSRRLYSRILGG